MYRRVLATYYETGKITPLVKPFTKIEKMSQTKYKAPRMIQARDPSFNIHFGKYIKPLEHKVFKDSKLSYHFGKGTQGQIAEKIWKLSNKWQYYTEGDHTTFDAYITTEMLKLVHKYYNACYQSPELAALCKRTLKNTCISRKGDKYKVEGTRMSGEMDTSFANSLVNIAILKELMHRLKIKGEAIVNGDDFIMFTNQPVNIKEAEKILQTMNMKTTMKESTKNIHTVEFCRNKIIINADGSIGLLKDVERTFNTFGMTHVQIDYYRNYLLENLYGAWQMNKTSPLGIAFKRMFNHANRLEYNYSGNTFAGQFKYLERDMQYSVREARKDRELKEDEITLSMITAYEEVLQLQKFEHKLVNRINIIWKYYPTLGSKILHNTKNKISRTLYINHTTQQIDQITDYS